MQPPSSSPASSPPPPPPQPQPGGQKEKLIPAIFTATPDSIDRLKAYSTPASWDMVLGSWPEISTFDAVASLLWRNIMAARLPELEPPPPPPPPFLPHTATTCTNTTTSSSTRLSRLRIPVSIRSSLQIPESYPGNCLLNAVTSFSLDELVSEPDGERTSPMIRSSILAARSSTNAREAVRLAKSDTLPELEKRVPVFGRGSDSRSGDLVLTSWRGLGFYGHDWGAAFTSSPSRSSNLGGGTGLVFGRKGGKGAPEFVRVPTDYLPGVCILLPSHSPSYKGIMGGKGDGGHEEDATRTNKSPLDVLVTMPRGQLERLITDREFRRYFEVLAV